MSAKIIPFPYKNKAVIDLLESQLALAKEGKIVFVAIAAVDAGSVGYSAWAPDNEIGQAALTASIGAVGFLNARFMESINTGAVDVDGPDAA